MEYTDQLKVQAYLDGELTDAEAREMAERLARDPEASALLAELRQTGAALKDFEAGLVVPESRDFYWSKVRREIERTDAPRAEPAKTTPALAWLYGWLRPAVAVALVMMVASLVIKQAWPRTPIHTAVTTLEDTGAFTYHDQDAGVTLVWLSYPAEKVLPGEEEVAIVQ